MKPARKRPDLPAWDVVSPVDFPRDHGLDSARLSLVPDYVDVVVGSRWMTVEFKSAVAEEIANELEWIAHDPTGTAALATLPTMSVPNGARRFVGCHTTVWVGADIAGGMAYLLIRLAINHVRRVGMLACGASVVMTDPFEQEYP
jgi:hypothetical protein